MEETINLGAKPLIYPQPVLVIATYNEDKTPNAMTAAWASVCDYTKVAIIIDKGHLTAKNIQKNKAFTVSIADQNHMKEADYLGIVSGNQEKNKIANCNLSIEESTKVNAPILSNFPLTLECTLDSYDERTERAIGTVVNTIAHKSIITDNTIDLKKFKPLIYDSLNHQYLSTGNVIGQAFSIGNEYKQKK